MRTLSDFEDRVDLAIQARHDERFEDALTLGEQLLQDLPVEERRLRAIVNNEMSYIYRQELKDARRAEPYARAAVMLSPRSELASLGLFHALAAQERWGEALSEIVRLVALRDSPEYRELLGGRGFRDDLRPSERALADEARALLLRWN